MSSNRSNQLNVWDPLVRIFHWSLVSFFSIAYITEDDLQGIHVWSGYAVATLVLFRLAWGVIGTRHAQFSDFVKSPSTTFSYIRQVMKGQSPRYIGHNPAGGAMVIALLGSLLMTTFFGMALLAIEGAGPFAGTPLANFPDDPLETLHELFANATLALVVLHVAGVMVSSFQHKENLIKAMFTGFKAR